MTVSFGSFDNTQVNILQATFELVCRELGVVSSDEKSRTRVASAVLAFANSDHLDPERMRLRALSQFRGAALRALELEPA